MLPLLSLLSPAAFVSHVAPESVRLPPSPPLPQAQPRSSLTWTREMTSPLAGPPSAAGVAPSICPLPCSCHSRCYKYDWHLLRARGCTLAWSGLPNTRCCHPPAQSSSGPFPCLPRHGLDLGNTLPASSFTRFPALPQHAEPLFNAGSFLRAHCWEFAQGDAKLPEDSCLKRSPSPQLGRRWAPQTPCGFRPEPLSSALLWAWTFSAFVATINNLCPSLPCLSQLPIIGRWG